MPSTRVPAPPTSARPTPTAPASAPPADAPVRLLDREHLPVVIGIIALVTLAAFENRAVMTILPTVVRELDGWALFGASTGAPLVTFTVAMAWSGTWTDRVGPRPVLHWGLGLFVIAQVVSALAPTMAVFVGGRAVSGAAEALIDTSLMVLVAQALPEQLRAKVFATFAAAWILPSLLGPSLAGGLDALAGWRVVFLGPLLVAPIAYVLLRPALARTSAHSTTSGTLGAGTPTVPDASDGPGSGHQAPRPVAALLLAAGLAVTTFAAPLLSQPATRPAGIAVIGAGALLVAIGAAWALPAGTARSVRGVPAVIAIRLLIAAAFTAVGGVIPLMLVQTHGATTAQAGVSLSVTGTMWAAGSWLSSTARAQRTTSPSGRIRLGSALIAVGSLGPILLSLGTIGLVPGLLGWAVAALGMGILSPTVSTQLLSLAPASEHGRVSAAQGLAVSTGVAAQTALVGAVVAIRGANTDGATFAALMAVGASLALVATIAAPRTATASP